MPNSISKKQEPALIANLNNGDPVHDELRADVQRLLEPPPIPARVRSKWSSPRVYWLRVILNKIEEMGFNQNRRTIVPLSKYHGPGWLPTESHNRLRLGNEWFIVADVPHLAGKRQTIYWVLDEALKSGEFSQVRRCRWCGRYFTTTRSDRLTCNPKCNVKRQNAKRQSTEDRLDEYTEARWEHREKMFKDAKELKAKGCSFQEIKKKTGLSERVFRKEQAGLGLVTLLERARKQGITTQ